MHPLRVALTGFIDYAGLFPPASLDLNRTAANHRRYAASPEAWLLGRLIIPAERLDQLSTVLPAAGVEDANPRWTISALVRTARLVEDLAAIDRFNARHAPSVAVVSVEAVGASVTDVMQVSRSVDPGLERYIEVPIGDDTETLLDTVSREGCYAKVRTGGMTPDRFPSSGELARVITGCQARHLPLKATAGLHHPVRNEFSVTGTTDGAIVLMHGFLNLLFAAVSCATWPQRPEQIERVLEERNPRAFTIERDSIRWHDASISIADCAEARAHLLRSVGSCSFEEPVADLRRLGWWPDG